MKVSGNVKRVCSFCVSEWHFITMITPYISQKLKDGENVKIYTSQDYTMVAKTFLSKLMLNDNEKNQIENLNWNAHKIDKEEIEQIKQSRTTVIVEGDNSFIKEINDNIETFSKKYPNRNITIVNCFEVMQFNQNIEEILKNHDKVLNTSGEKEISEVFEGFDNNYEGAS